MRCLGLLALLSAIFNFGCFAPSYGDGQLRCAAAPHACPDGYHCANQTCWRDGHEPPPLHSGSVTFTAGGGVGMATPGQARATLSIGQPISGSGAASDGHAVTFGTLAPATAK